MKPQKLISMCISYISDASMVTLLHFRLIYTCMWNIVPFRQAHDWKDIQTHLNYQHEQRIIDSII